MLVKTTAQKAVVFLTFCLIYTFYNYAKFCCYSGRNTI